jgi:hypothetical protein
MTNSPTRQRWREARSQGRMRQENLAASGGRVAPTRWPYPRLRRTPSGPWNWNQAGSSALLEIKRYGLPTNKRC